MTKHLNNRELAAFRRDVGALKKAGILPPSTKVRNAYPTTVKAGKTLREYVAKFKAATPSGGSTAKIVQVSPKTAREYRKLDYTTDGRRGKPATHVMVPAAKDSKVTVNAAGKITVRTSSGIETVHLPIEYHNLPQYLADVQANSAEINRMKHKNESFGFQFYGSNSKRGFANIQSLISYLTGYNSVDTSLNKKSSKEAREIIQNLVIVKGPDKSMFEFIDKEKRNLQRGVRVNKSKAETRKNWPEWKKKQYREKRRKEEQKRRDRNKKR
jgi:hypothetical protein